MLKPVFAILILVSVAYLLMDESFVERTIEIGRIFFVFSLLFAVISLSIRVISDNSPDEIV